MLSYEQARSKVVAEVVKRKGPRATTVVSVWEAVGMVLAQEVRTDREYPPFNRSTRDGYAVRSSEAGPDARLKCVGEIKAGETPTSSAASCTRLPRYTPPSPSRTAAPPLPPPPPSTRSPAP